MAQQRLSSTQLTDLIREFGNQFTKKLVDDKPLRDLLGNSLDRHLANVNIDPGRVDLVVEVLVWEFAVDVASKFPLRLADKLKPRGEPGAPSSRPSGGDTGPTTSKTHTPLQTSKTPVDARK
ncbi:MAG: hypothetical protein M1840_007783 [Geoglossum simile]|nr:MAG: hypothetical protein M1840_007783 [Geoglossum simile]